MKNEYSSIKKIIKDAKRGKMFILVDDESRENEGDLVIPASRVSAKSINFMAKYGRGLICLALNQIQVNKIGNYQHIADLALYLASPKGDYITGQTISVDGGLYMS